jgi:branched-subunit amino acid transport protein
MTLSTAEIWIVIVGLGIGTFLIRFSFLGLVGDRPLPGWLLRLLRYTPVAVLPGLVAPLVLWPQATGGEPDPARLTAAAATVGLGLATRNTLIAIFGGALTLFGMLWLVG